MPYEFGDVVLVRFPFTNQAAFKQRPACIVSSRAYNAAKPDVIIMAITSQVHTLSSLGEVQVGQWQAANLLKPLAINAI
jgi:mRNA interferase MazF